MRVACWTRVLIAQALVALASAGACLAGSVHDMRGEALRLYEAGQYREALPLIDEVLRQKTHDIDLLNKRGCIYLRLNQPGRALPDFDRALQYSPFLSMPSGAALTSDNPFRWYSPPLTAPFVAEQYYASAFTNRGIAKLMLGRDEDALSDFQRSIANRTAFPQIPAGRTYQKWLAGMAAAYGGIGQYYHRKGVHSGALEAYDKSLSYFPDDPHAHIGRGVALSGLGRLDDALSSFGEAIRIDPSNSRAFGYRAGALDQLGRDDEALSDYGTAIRLDPRAGMFRRMRGASLSRAGKHEAAIADLDEAIRLDPKDAEAFKDRGGVYNRMGDSVRALRDLDEAVRLDPRSAKAYQNRAASHNGLARFDEAVRDCDEALKLDPRNAGALNNRGLAQAGLGRYERAIADLTESIRIEPRQAAAYVNRGGAFAQLGRFDAASADYDEALRREPRVALSVAGFGTTREMLHARARSAPDDLAVRHQPVGASEYRERGNARRAAGDWDGAVAEFSRAIDLDPRDAEAYSLRGWSRLCAGEPGADADARSWFGLSSWRDPFAPYMALLGVLAARGGGREFAATAFLDEALANTRPPAWPSPLFRYLKQQITAADLSSAAGDPRRMTEARTVVGLDLLSRGDRAGAMEHLIWVRDHGSHGSIARDLARETLRRAENPADSPALPR